MDPIRESRLLQTRRQFFGSVGMGLGTAALATLLGEEARAALPGTPQRAFPTAYRPNSNRHGEVSMKLNSLTILTLSLPIALVASVSGCGNSVQAGPEPNMTAAFKIRSSFKAAGPAKTSAAESGGAELKRLEGWATVRGRFVLDGDVPAAAPIRAGPGTGRPGAACGRRARGRAGRRRRPPAPGRRGAPDPPPACRTERAMHRALPGPSPSPPRDPSPKSDQ